MTINKINDQESYYTQIIDSLNRLKDPTSEINTSWKKWTIGLTIDSYHSENNYTLQEIINIPNAKKLLEELVIILKTKKDLSTIQVRNTEVKLRMINLDDDYLKKMKELKELLNSSKDILGTQDMTRKAVGEISSGNHIIRKDLTNWAVGEINSGNI